MREGDGKVAGGFCFVQAESLLEAWAGLRRGDLTLLDVRVWLACHECVVRRIGLKKGRIPKYRKEEVAELLGVARRSVASSLVRLQTTDAALQRDRARYEVFVKAFPSNTGPINWLRDLNVDGFSFERDGLTRVGPLIYDWTAPESGFSNPAVQAALKTLTKAANAFLSYTSFNTWPVNGKEGRQSVPPEWEDTHSERFRTTVDTIHKHAEAVVEAHRALIETARRELGV